MLAALVVLAVGATLLPFDQKLAGMLEDRFPPSPVSRVDGIVVLGGAVDIAMSMARNRPSVNEAAERVTELVALARRFPDARIVFSGGSGNPFDQSVKEASVMRRLLAEMGVDDGRIVYENRSRNTHENAVYSKLLAQPGQGQSWLLVTSAIHMPRAMGCFDAEGWPMTAWPVGYATTGDGRDRRLFTPRRLQILDNALHEAFGLVYYRLRGWTNAWFPGP